MLLHLSQAWKSWKTARSSALLAVVALSAGIGSVTAIFTIINAVLLRPLPYQNSERWMMVLGQSPRDPESRSSITLEDLRKFRERNRSFEVFGWFKAGNFNLTSPGAPQHLSGVEVMPELANNLGVNPIMGQWFRDANQPAAIISQALWQRLGADTAILGKPVTLNGRVYSITGVMPSWFQFPMAGPYGEVKADVWIPLDPRGGPNVEVPPFTYARLKPGVTREQADSDMKRIAAEIVKEDSVGHPDFSAAADGILDLVMKDIRPTLYLLFSAAGLLLLITVANVAGLLLTRSVVRARETAVRIALGASRGQLAMQYFFEGLFVSLLGAAGGTAISLALVRGVHSLAADLIPRSHQLTVDWMVLAFTLGISILANTICGLAPLWQALRTPPNDVLTEGVRASAGARSRSLTRSLVVAEIALAFTLLSGCALLLTQLSRLQRVSPGFDPNNVLTFQVTIPDPINAHAAQRLPYVQRLLRAVEAVPGITAAGTINQLPLGGCCYVIGIYPQDRTANFRVEKTSYMVASPSYFRAIGLPLKRGRLLAETDTRHELFNVVINEAAAKLYWPDKDPIGAFGRFNAPEGDRFQVVGVVGDVRNDGLGKPSVPEFYLSANVMALRVNPVKFVVRSSLPVNTLTTDLARAVQSVDSTQPVYEVQSALDIIRESMTLQRIGALTMSFFALAALLMATLGVYGVVAYSMRQRTVEIGTRMAFGALPGDLLRLIVGAGLKMAVIGIAIGGVAMFASTSLLARVLDIKDFGILPFLISTVVVTMVACAASLFPAWRATLLSPMVAIRSEAGAILQSAPRREHVDEGEVPGGSPLADFIQASRRSAGFPEALQSTIEALRTRIGAQWMELVEDTAHYPYSLNRLRFHSSSLPFTREDYEQLQLWAANNKPAYLPEIEALARSDARLLLPLRTTRQILSILRIGPPLKGDRFPIAAKRAVDESAGQLALMIENGRLTSRVVEQEMVRRDLAMAAEVQRRLLPQSVPESAVATFAVFSLPARSIGGDYYDFLRPANGLIGIALADVAGKGIAAALIMSLVQASLRVMSSEGETSLSELTAKMNRFLKRSAGSNRTSFATFLYAVLDENTRALHYVNAGHNPPLLWRADRGAIEQLHTGDKVIGMFNHVNYREAIVDLHPGDVLLAFTDGVTEAMNPQGEEFGLDRLRELLPALAPLAANDISLRLKFELESWTGNAPQHDDITFIVVHF